jgi:hypothetical protein
MKIDKTDIMLIFLILNSMIIGSVGTLLILDFDSSTITQTKNVESLEQIANDCSNLSLEDTAKCLRNNIEVIYNYKTTWERNATRNTNRTFEDIKENGGNCYDYTNLYMQLATILGFNNSFISQTEVKNVVYAHRYFIMWNETHYCEIDQTSIKCMEIDYN